MTSLLVYHTYDAMETAGSV